jgi:sortase A
MITAGVVVLLFVVYQLWGTNLQEARAQADLRDEFDDTLEAARAGLGMVDAGDPDDMVDAGDPDDMVDAGDPDDMVDAGDPDGMVDDLPPPSTSSTLPGGLSEEVLRFFFPEDGDAVARIEIPAIGVDKIVVNGVQVADLRTGPGHYPSTAPVGTTGNTSIAGHRTTYGAPFNRIDELRVGDEIHVTGILGRFTYEVMDAAEAYDDEIDADTDDLDEVGDGFLIVRPSATWVLGDFGDDRLTLTACHPKLSSRQRIVVAAALVDEPAPTPSFDPATGTAPDDEASIPGEVPDAGDGADTEPGAGEPLGGDLDEGLDGDRTAVPGAVFWLVAATTVWVAAGYLGRRLFDDRLRRLAVRTVGVLPAGACLWFAFELIDRALPAG